MRVMISSLNGHQGKQNVEDTLPGRGCALRTEPCKWQQDHLRAPPKGKQQPDGPVLETHVQGR
jgi:hypothetical protein